ncbi:MAG: hypothetical protein AB7G93_16405 [Bdellovibrionales bacterium]
MKILNKSKSRSDGKSSPGALARESFQRLAGESRFIPNLHFQLSETQLELVSAALTKRKSAHSARVAWHGPHSLDDGRLSIHALDFISVLDHCRRSSENEMELFRLRRSATDQLQGSLARSRNEIKKRNLKMWLEYYAKLWPGSEADKDISQPPKQPKYIPLIP